MSPEISVDVAVVGGGIMGAATAWQLTQRGARVALCDALRPGHDMGSSHGAGRIARFTYSESIYLEMARRSFDRWSEVEKTADVTLLETTGSWECGPEHSGELAELIEALERHRIPHEIWDSVESNRRFPHFNLPRTSRAVFQRDGAVLRAERAWRSLWHLLQVAGAALLADAPVLSLDIGPRGVSFRAGATLVRAGVVVVTAGAWSRELVQPTGLDLPLTVTRETIAYFAPASNASASATDHRVGAMPTLIDYHSPQPFYALPMFEDSTEEPGVKIGWHHAGHEIEPTRIPNTHFGGGDADAKIVERLVSYVGDRFPFLQMRPLHATSCLYTNTPDYHFVLGRHPGQPRVVIGTGFSGHGFKFAPVVGEILADLATDTEPCFDLGLFRPQRFAEGPSPRRRIA
ncbi:MAG: N-methyl-L-tryptophan oxidase [Thermoanaerobaculia bacterium]|nr:N-methyl-L-tryptophan oxidase [Thermoanaerobaculia bacterium]